jgi:hypothetical protein
VSGIDSLHLVGNSVVEIPAAATRSVSVALRAEAGAGKPGANPVWFKVTAEDDVTVFVNEKASFIQP